MRVILIIAWLASSSFGGFLFLNAETVLQELAGLLLGLIGSVYLCAVYIEDALTKRSKELAEDQLSPLGTQVSQLLELLHQMHTARGTPVLPPAPGTEKYWLLLDGKVIGPVSKARLEALLDDPDATHVLREGDTEWRAISESAIRGSRS